MRRELPPELLKLRVLLNKVEKLTREDVPSMASEIKRLRSQNKRLEAEAEASHPSLSSDSLDPIEAEVTAPEVPEVIEPEAVAEVATDGLDHESLAEVEMAVESEPLAEVATDGLDHEPVAEVAAETRDEDLQPSPLAPRI
jgi:hypothetical protein